MKTIIIIFICSSWSSPVTQTIMMTEIAAGYNENVSKKNALIKALGFTSKLSNLILNLNVCRLY